jgi:hypothetical protein
MVRIHLPPAGSRANSCTELRKSVQVVARLLSHLDAHDLRGCPIEARKELLRYVLEGCARLRPAEPYQDRAHILDRDGRIEPGRPISAIPSFTTSFVSALR